MSKKSTVVTIIMLSLCRAVSLEAQRPAVALSAPVNHFTTDQIATEASHVRWQAGTYKVHGAVAGFVIGAGATTLVLYSGGSNSLCDSSSNQDAMNTSECLGLVALGGAVGGLAGYLVGGRIHRNVRLEIGARRTHVAAPERQLVVQLRRRLSW